MIKFKYMIIVLMLVAIAIACKKPYNPTIISTPNHYLVVEGTINSGNDATIIRLSLTTNVAEGTQPMPVSAEAVSVQDETGNAKNLQPSGIAGTYTSGSGLNLDPLKKYRLFIAYNGQQYASDYTLVKKNPPIDSIGFAPKNGNLNIYVNTHDATNGTRYYRWDYEEAWKFHAKYQTGIIVDATTKIIRNRTEDEASYYCYAGDASSNVIISSSAKLTSDVIFQAPVTLIPSTAEKLSVRYSILLKQYALTKEEFEFWENIKKNSEQLGSIFDAQPSQLQGNVHCISKPSEPVIGYIGVTNVQVKRIYINNNQLPLEWFPKYPYDCTLDTALIYNPKNMQNEVQGLIIDGGSIPVSSIEKQRVIIGYLYSSIECTDCRIRGNSAAPPFWIP